MPNPTLQAFPLTEQQKHVWKTQAPHALSPAIAEIEVNGPLDERALRGAVETLGRTHEILRTVYHVPPGSEPLQVIQDDAEPWDGGESSNATFGKPAAFRCDVKHGPAGQTRLFVQIPALSADHTSFEILFHQLAASYEAKLSGENPPEGVFQYADYAQWQADLREQEASLEARRFWAKALDVQPALKLPLEKAVDENDFVPRTLQFLVAPEAQALLAKRAAEWVVSEESLLAGVWGALLGRMTGSLVIPMSVESPGRTYEELDDALGLFDRWLPIGFSPDEKQTLRMTAGQVQKLLLESRRHGDGFSSPAKDAARSRPLLFNRRREVEPISVQGITFRLVSIECPTEPFRVKLECRRRAAGEVILLSYDSSRISLTEANSVGERFLQLLAHGLAAPDAPLKSLPCVASQEQRILTQWAWSPPPRRVLPILQRFAESAQNHPRTIAVRCAGETATYEELNERAHRLAHYLRNLGVRDGQPVGLCAERSVDLVAGILGILKAGGAYVPLDPGYPSVRIDFMVRDAGIKVVVAQPRLLELFDSHQVERVALCEENRQLHQSSTADPEVAIPPDQLAYIIYTSGSTGAPKGVMIRHSSLAISTAARLEYYPDPVHNYLLLSSFSFDSSIAGIFWALSSGGTLTLPAEGTHQDPLEVLRLVSCTNITHLLALPSFYQAILERGSGADLRSLRTVIVAGEACPATLVRKHGQNLPQAALYNEYGPTEATVWSAVHRCLPRDSMQNVPIGRPVPGLGIYILDEHGHHAGLGVAGEIYIAGPTLADGYRNRPDLTAEKFVESPVQQGVRLYRTGDLGRFLENGEIEFLGRIDHQVKIRGYRIELGEIEQLLKNHDAVEEAAVIAREDTPGDKRLVAYVVPRVSGQALVGQLRQLLSATLPAYMIPASFVLLEKMPLSPNGKLDRKALPAPSRAGRLLGKNQIPAGPEEELLARIWADLLKLERVGRRDNFFELGGHSLLALQMLARVRDTTQVELPLRSVFDRPTLEELALVLTANRRGAPSERRQIRRVPRQAMARDFVEQWEDTAAGPASPTSAT